MPGDKSQPKIEARGPLAHMLETHKPASKGERPPGAGNPVPPMKAPGEQAPYG